ncbi:MAG: hypothetical protein HY298_08585 [Verrucomicrobia bacterium]|nr:hypothetical protein [Verrucomicrobiota bacterium]
MLETIEKLLILQNRDLKIIRLKNELARLEPERQSLNARAASAQSGLEAAKLRGKLIDTERKKLELEVDARKQLIEKYSLQQFQTKKNDEFKALAHEIEMCRKDITKLEDQQLDLMEQGEAAQNGVTAASQKGNETKKLVDAQIIALSAREESLRKELAEVESGRAELVAAIDDIARARYERLLKHRGENVVVGVQHGVCGGCHMKLPAQVLVSCQAEQEIVTCINCGRILYYTRDMELAAAE